MIRLYLPKVRENNSLLSPNFPPGLMFTLAPRNGDKLKPLYNIILEYYIFAIIEFLSFPAPDGFD